MNCEQWRRTQEVGQCPVIGLACATANMGFSLSAPAAEDDGRNASDDDVNMSLI